MPRPSQTPEAHREERVSGCAPTTGCPTLRAMAKTTRPATRTQKARAHEPTVAGPTFESEHLERLADEGAAAWTKILRDRRDPHRRHAGEARPASSIGGHGMGAPDGPRGSTATDPPWARLPSESSKAFSCFQRYRDLSPLDRSVAKVAEKVGKSVGYCERLSTRHRWVERATAFDDETDRVAQLRRFREVAAMQDRHAAIAAACLDQGIQRLKTLDPNTLQPSDVARLLEVASRTERMARGVLADELSVQERGLTISAGDLRRKLKEGAC